MTPTELEALRARADEAAAFSGIAQHTHDWAQLNAANDQLLSVIDALFTALETDQDR